MPTNTDESHKPTPDHGDPLRYMRTRLNDSTLMHSSRDERVRIISYVDRLLQEKNEMWGLLHAINDDGCITDNYWHRIREILSRRPTA